MSNKRLAGVHALVTGATSGLGLAMAEAMLREGAYVILTARSVELLKQTVNRLKEEGLQAYALPLDVRDERSIDHAVKWVQETWGSLDVLVNNAGIGMRTVNPNFMVEPQPFYKVTPEGFRNVIDTNLTGYFLVARAFTPLMLEKRKGKIINISMNHETMKRKGFIPYGPSRAGAESLSYIMAEDLRDTGITVNMLLPGGATETGMIPEELKQNIPISLLQPEIMGEPIIYLASSDSDNVTGERIIATEFQDWLKKKREDKPIILFDSGMSCGIDGC